MMISRPQPAQPAPLRISYLLPQFPVPTEVFAVSDIAALRGQGHEVMVHTVKPRRSDEERRLDLAGVPRDIPIRRPSWRGAMRWPALLWKHRRPAGLLVRAILEQAKSAPTTALTALLSLPRILEIADETEAWNADIVHVFWSRHAGMVLPVLAGSGSSAIKSAFVGAYDLVADDFLVDITLKWSDLTFTHAETNRAYFASKAPQDIPVSVIHRGIPLMTRDVTIARDPWFWLTASALTPAKNIEAVLRAFAETRKEQPALRLEICGDGPDRPRLERISYELGCSVAITFSGHIGREDLFRHMQRASLFLLLSKKPTERLPNVVKEALWAGCAVISSQSEGIEELLPDSRYGHIVDPNDSRAIATAVQSVLAETGEQARARQLRAGTLIAERFSSDASMRGYVEAWLCAMTTQTEPGSPRRQLVPAKLQTSRLQRQELAQDG